MIDHLSTYATDYQATKTFYLSVFKPLGYSIQSEFVAHWNQQFPTQKMCAFGTDGQFSFWVIETQQPSTPRHIAFSADNRTKVDDFYQAGIDAGGRDNGAPGLRPHYHEHYYAAFLLDSDGNNVEAVCHTPVNL